MKYSPQNYALRLLELRDRTEAEIRKKMKEKGFLAEEIEKTVRWLKEKDFINDEKFAKRLVESQKSKVESGKRKVVFKMYKLGISKELIDKYSGDIVPEDELEKAKELAEKWLKKNTDKDNKYQKLGSHLAGKGYEIDIVKQVLSEVLKD